MFDGVTSSGRFPCWDCTLKHLGTAAICLGTPCSMNYTDALERTKIFISEMVNGYSEHQWLAVGCLNLIENCMDQKHSHVVRNVRKDLMVKSPKNINVDALRKTLESLGIDLRLCISNDLMAIARANIIEAMNECPDDEVGVNISEWNKSGTSNVPNIMEWIFKINAKRDIFESIQG